MVQVKWDSRYSGFNSAALSISTQPERPLNSSGGKQGLMGTCKFRFVDAVKTLSKMDLGQVLRGHLGWRTARGGAAILKRAGGHVATEQAKSNWMEKIEYYYVIQSKFCQV